jgi:membrane-associated protein
VVSESEVTPPGRREEDGPGAAGATPPRRGRWSRREYSPEEIEQAKQAWRDIRPWESPMQRADKVLIGAIFGVAVIMLLTLPFRPFLVASHPTALALATGSSSAVGAGAAFARLGQADLWLVIVAGIIGKIKFDWLYWWAGRRWGAKGVKFFVPTDRAQRFVSAVRSWPPWAVPLLLVVSAVPGVPAALAFLLAGLAGTRLVTFLLFDALGAAMLVGLIAGLGYGLGQYAVDVVLAVDRYALWISLALILAVSVQAGRRESRKQKQRAATSSATSPAGAEVDGTSGSAGATDR